MFPAARKGDPITHDLVTPTGVIGPPVTGPCPMGVVMIEMLPAAHVMCTVVCSGVTSAGPVHPPLPVPPAPPPPIVMGSATVLIHNMPAARWAPSGDLAVCTTQLGNPALIPTRTTLIGGPATTVLPPPTTDAETMMQAMFLVKTSAFAQTPEGRLVVARLEQLYVKGNLNFVTFANARTRGQWRGSADQLEVGARYNRDAEATASELVHEATHGVHRDTHGQNKSNTIDEEERTNTNQLDFYEEQRGRGFRDPELERRRTDRAGGTLRDNIRRRYPGAPEND